MSCRLWTSDSGSISSSGPCSAWSSLLHSYVGDNRILLVCIVSGHNQLDCTNLMQNSHELDVAAVSTVQVCQSLLAAQHSVCTPPLCTSLHM